jgi:hypothetical protein
MSEEKEPMTVDRAIEECEAQIAIEQANVDMKIGCVECSKGHIDFLKRCLEALGREKQDALKAAEYKERWMHAILRLYRITALRNEPDRGSACDADVVTAERALPGGKLAKVKRRVPRDAVMAFGDDDLEGLLRDLSERLDEEEQGL